MCPICKEIALEYEEMHTGISVMRLGFDEERSRLISQIESLNRRLKCESELVEMLTSSLPDLMREFAQERIRKEQAKVDRVNKKRAKEWEAKLTKILK